MDLQNKDMQVLIRRAVCGSMEAYSALILECQDYMYRIAFLYMKNEDMAMDVVGDCVLKGFSTIRTLKHPEYFKTWLTRVVINCAVDTLRRRTPDRLPDEELLAVSLTGAEAGISAEERMDLYQAIDLLPEKYRIVTILRYFGELSIREIAQSMEIPEGSVKVYLYRAKRALREILKEGYDD